MLRRNRRATVLLIVFAGLAAGVVTTAFEVARRTQSAVPRRTRYVDLATTTVEVCPKDHDAEDPTACYSEVDGPEAATVRDRIRAAPGVRRVLRGGYSYMAVRPAGSSASMSSVANFVSFDRDGDTWAVGRAQLIQGRMPAFDAPDEVLIDNHVAAALELGPGDRIDLRPFTQDEFLAFAGGSPPPSDPNAAGVVTGVFRESIVDSGESSVGQGIGTVLTSAGWWRAHRDQSFVFGPEYAVWLDDGAHGQDAFAAALPRAFPDNDLRFSSGVRENGSVKRAVATEAAAASAVAFLALLAVLLLVGQALARQLTRELADGSTLRALGMSRSGAALAGTARVLPIALGAAVVAAIAAAVASPLGPVGIGRRAEVSRGVHLDWLVLAVGALAVNAAIIGLAAAVVLAGQRSPTRARSARAWRGGGLPATARVGLALSRSRRGRSSFGGALAGVAAGLAAVAAAFVLMGSLSDLQTHRARVGTTFTSVLAQGDSVVAEDNERLQAIPVVKAATARATIERALPGGLDDEVLMAFETVVGDGVPRAVLEGREPEHDNEIALGTVTMRRLGVNVGDTVTGVGATVGHDAGPLTVVGRIVLPVYDSFSVGMGHGGIVTTSLLRTISPGSRPQDTAIITDPAIPIPQALATLREALGDRVFTPIEPPDVANLRRISRTPILLAGLIVALAGAALAHALLTGIRRSRREIGVVRALGFTRPQVAGALAWQASALAAAASVIGLTVGLVGGRWGWGLVERRLGVVSPAHVPAPMIAMLVALAGALAFANLVALIPGVRVARISVADALRAD